MMIMLQGKLIYLSAPTWDKSHEILYEQFVNATHACFKKNRLATINDIFVFYFPMSLLFGYEILHVCIILYLSTDKNSKIFVYPVVSNIIGNPHIYNSMKWVI